MILLLVTFACVPKNVKMDSPIHGQAPVIVDQGFVGKTDRYYIYDNPKKPNELIVLISGPNRSQDVIKLTHCDHTPCTPEYWGEVWVVNRYPTPLHR